MHDNFPAQAYGQRRHIESAFSQFKRTLGSALTARTRKRRQQELALRIITFNLMLIFFFIHFAAPDQH
jgi:transposase